jgi:hypothetical protein
MLPTEMHLIWRHPKPWFLLIRYLALVTNIIVVVSIFGNFGPEVCPNGLPCAGVDFSPRTT